MSPTSETFFEYGGIAWKTLADGSVEMSAYCPTCHKVVGKTLSYQYVVCVECGLNTGVKRTEIPELRETIARGLK